MFQKTVVTTEVADNVTGGSISAWQVSGMKLGDYGMCYRLKKNGMWIRDAVRKGGGYKECNEK